MRRIRRGVETPVEAQQGFLDCPAFVVLIASCALIIVFLGFTLGQVFRTARARLPR
jgi:hypothetical protein